jgi:nitroreductase
MIETTENSVLDAIRTRRAVRAFRPDPLPREILTRIIEAGNSAPSGGNCQPWRFVVVEDLETRHRLRDAAYPYWKEEFERGPFSDHFKDLVTEMYQRCVGWEHQPFDELRPKIAIWKDAVYYDAPVFVFVVGTDGDAAIDCAMACLNMMLAAHALGVGSIWVSHGLLGLKDPQVKNDLGIKDDEQAFGPVLLGYPRIVPSPPRKKEPVVRWV